MSGPGEGGGLMARRTLTDPERAARADRLALLAAAADRIGEMDPERGERAALILGRYSMRNVLMILAQADERGRDCPAAVAGFHDWRKAGRIVRKGAKGYAVFAPVIRKDKDTGEDVRTGYSIRYVFDVADTDPLTAADPATLRELETA